MTGKNNHNEKQLPKDWKWVKLGDAGKIISGGTPSTTIPEYWKGNINWIAPSDLTGYKKKTIKKGAKSITEVGLKNSSARLMPKGSVLFSSRAPIGYVVIADEELSTNQGFKSVIPNENIVSDFLYYYLLASKRRAEQVASGTTFKEISLSKFSELNFPLPPKPTQLAIVSKIEELFSELDKGIENLRLAQQQIKTYRQAVLKWAFEGRLTNENVEEGKLPKGWKMVSIEEVATVGTGATPLKSNSEYYGGDIAWVTSGALNDEYVREATDFVTEKAVRETNLSVYPKHTLLVAMYGEGKTRGKCSELLIEACTNQAIAAIYFEEKEISIKPYLKYFLLKNYTDVRKKSSGGVQPNLNLGIIKKLQFPVAPMEEQNKIIQEIESRLSVADKMEESIAQSLQQAEALRQSILKKAFEGRLV